MLKFKLGYQDRSNRLVAESVRPAVGLTVSVSLEEVLRCAIRSEGIFMYQLMPTVMPDKEVRCRFTLKSDKYRKARGGTAHFLNIYCVRCNAFVLLYQKDGPGQVLRLYLNRIFAPQCLAELQDDTAISVPSQLSPLACFKCGEVIGTGIHYRDGRLAFLLRQGLFFKRKSDGVYPPAFSNESDDEE